MQQPLKMIQNKEKILDDVAQIAGGTVSALSGLGQNIREEIKARTDEMAQKLDWVPREDFEALEQRVKVLEEQLGKAKK